MRFSEDTDCERIGGRLIIFPPIRKPDEKMTAIRLNQTGETLAELLKTGTEREDMVRAITERYDTDEETAGRDVDRFITCLTETGCIE